ncbi:MAG: OmpA family protein [Gammaproteobacteria bacterium]|jgi:OOP family OmpA-OmpF porin
MNMAVIKSQSGTSNASRSQKLAACYITFVVACAAVFAASVAVANEHSSASLPADAATTTSTDPFELATEAHDRALQANAPRYAESAWRSADKTWQKMLDARADGKLEKALELAEKATELGREAEQEAIRSSVLEPARMAIDGAVRNKASRYAPRTLERARQLAARAEDALAKDNYATENAENIANEAVKTANHAAQIAAAAAKKPSTEEVILEWESYMRQVQQAAGLEIAIDSEFATAAEVLAAEVARMRKSEQQLTLDLANSQAFNAALEEEIRELDDRLGGASEERQQLMIRLEEQARAREQLAQAEALFSEEEALVFRQSDDIVVRVIGLRFASGSPNLDLSNEQLLQKLGKVIELYPGSVILVEGHTDSRGSDRINKLLSEQRAQAVANHFISEMRVAANRLLAIGYGSDKPIANNETAAGREKNRRIDLVITPVNNSAF